MQKASLLLDSNEIWRGLVDIRPKAVIRVVDLETTGLNLDDEVVEIGAVDLDICTREICDVASQIVRPGKPIPPQASAIHHLTDVDVADAPRWPDVWPQIFNSNPSVVAFASHNANFDGRWLSGDLLGGKPLICTCKAALRVWPEAPEHKNQTLRYWLNLPVDRDRTMPTHRALPDAYVTAHLLGQLLDRASVDDLVSWSSQPALLPKVTFGKHFGSKWADVPVDYMNWVISKGDFDENVMYTVKFELARRASLTGSSGGVDHVAA
jgi:exodeoxyribonuclease X